MQDGGCHPDDGRYFPDQPFSGADFQWLAAQVVNEEGETPLPSYRVMEGASVPGKRISLKAENLKAGRYHVKSSLRRSGRVGRSGGSRDPGTLGTGYRRRDREASTDRG
jgi:hypothetical protein